MTPAGSVVVGLAHNMKAMSLNPNVLQGIKNIQVIFDLYRA